MAAPFVSGVAALVFAAHPEATPSQVIDQIEATAIDLGPRGRDLTSGAGLIDPAAAVSNVLPQTDSAERNDSPRRAARLATSNATNPPFVAAGQVDTFDDPHDLYPIDLARGRDISIVVRPTRGRVGLRLWKPGTTIVNGRRDPRETAATVRARGYRTELLAGRADSLRSGPKRLVFTAAARGRYLLDVVGLRGRSPYILKITPR